MPGLLLPMTGVETHKFVAEAVAEDHSRAATADWLAARCRRSDGSERTVEGPSETLENLLRLAATLRLLRLSGLVSGASGGLHLLRALLDDISAPPPVESRSPIPQLPAQPRTPWTATRRPSMPTTALSVEGTSRGLCAGFVRLQHRRSSVPSSLQEVGEVCMARFAKLERLCIAGQGELWLGRDKETDEEVVIKYLRSDPATSNPGAERYRFQREVRSQSLLRHDSIMPIFAEEFSDEPPWYVMPKADHSLEDWLNEHGGVLPDPETVRVMGHVLDAIEHSHKHKILHRDLKPANILMLNGIWVVADFGLCRDLDSDSTTITQVDSRIGTIGYMAPEQFHDGHRVGPTADIYSIGAIMYHCLLGRPPFPRPHLEALPARYRYVVSKCLEEKRGDRYRAVSELRHDLEALGRPHDRTSPPIFEAREILTSLGEGRPEAASKLANLLLRESDDAGLYKKFVALMPLPALLKLSEDAKAFELIMRQLDHHSRGQQPVEYVDVVTDLFSQVYSFTRSASLRRMCVTRILLMAHEHRRMSARDTFCRIAEDARTQEDALLVANLLRQYPEATEFVGPELRRSDVTHEIKRAIFRAVS